MNADPQPWCMQIRIGWQTGSFFYLFFVFSFPRIWSSRIRIQILVFFMNQDPKNHSGLVLTGSESLTLKQSRVNFLYRCCLFLYGTRVKEGVQTTNVHITFEIHLPTAGYGSAAWTFWIRIRIHVMLIRNIQKFHQQFQCCAWLIWYLTLKCKG